jgi:hypothetical protein
VQAADIAREKLMPYIFGSEKIKYIEMFFS